MIPRLHLLTHDHLLAEPGFAERAEHLLELGGDRIALHLRGPGTGGRQLWELGGRLLPVADACGALLLVNDRVDVALALGSGGGGPGVHLAGRSLPTDVVRRLVGGARVLGRSIHDETEVREAGLDYLVVGTLYPTPSHPGRPPAGPERLARIAADVGIPVLGVGGVTPGRAAELRRQGACGVAVIRGVWNADDPAAALEAYLDALDGDRRDPPVDAGTHSTRRTR